MGRKNQNNPRCHPNYHESMTSLGRYRGRHPPTHRRQLRKWSDLFPHTASHHPAALWTSTFQIVAFIFAETLRLSYIYQRKMSRTFLIFYNANFPAFYNASFLANLSFSMQYFLTVSLSVFYIFIPLTVDS